MKYPGIQIVIIRQVFSSLEQVFINKLIANFPKEIFGYKYNKQDKIATFSNGSRIIFRPLNDDNDLEKIKGAEYQLMIIDEANEILQSRLERIYGSCRNAHVEGYTATIMQTGNPGGISDIYFKTRYINPDYKHWSPGELKYKDMFVFISANVYDNKYLLQDDSYMRTLDSLSPEMRKAWLEGDWSAFEGQFFPEFNPNKHVVEPFEIPDSWYKVCGIDLGFSKEHPTVALWLAQDPVTEIVYVYREFTGEPKGSVEQYAQLISNLCEADKIDRCVGDPSIWSEGSKKKDSDQSAGDIFLQYDLYVEKADNRRINGWRIVKQWMTFTQRRPPKLQIFSSCEMLLETIPIQQYAKQGTAKAEDLDTTGSDDYLDALRYALVSGFQYVTERSEELDKMTEQQAIQAQEQQKWEMENSREMVLDYQRENSRFQQGSIYSNYR